MPVTYGPYTPEHAIQHEKGHMIKMRFAILIMSETGLTFSDVRNPDGPGNHLWQTLCKITHAQLSRRRYSDPQEPARRMILSAKYVLRMYFNARHAFTVKELCDMTARNLEGRQ